MITEISDICPQQCALLRFYFSFLSKPTLQCYISMFPSGLFQVDCSRDEYFYSQNSSTCSCNKISRFRFRNLQHPYVAMFHMLKCMDAAPTVLHVLKRHALTQIFGAVFSSFWRITPSVFLLALKKRITTLLTSLIELSPVERRSGCHLD